MIKDQNKIFVHAGVVRRIMSDLLDTLFGLLLMAFLLLCFLVYIGIQHPTIMESVISIVTSNEKDQLTFGLVFFATYTFLLLSSKRQATWGMRILRLKLTDTNYGRPGLKKCGVLVISLYFLSVLHLFVVWLFSLEYSSNIGYFIDGVPMIIGIFMIVKTKYKQGYWDMIAGTFVIHTPSYKAELSKP
jgi:uncharacterized RDD family membrane protein YckC